METRDLNLAAALVASGIELRAVRGHDTYSTFEFDATEAVQQVAADFHSRRLRVDAASYGEAMRGLKSAAIAARQQFAPVG